jgi:hypothetical protein
MLLISLFVLYSPQIIQKKPTNYCAAKVRIYWIMRIKSQDIRARNQDKKGKIVLHTMRKI